MPRNARGSGRIPPLVRLVLRFPAVLANRARLLGSSCFGPALALACAVFPDHAVLPEPIAAGGAGGQPAPPVAGEGGAAGRADVLPIGGVGGGGAVGAGGAALGGTGDGGTAGFADIPSNAGAGGAAAPPCQEPRQSSIKVAIDLWVGSANKKANHGEDTQLFVLNGAQEQRAMFQLELPKAEAFATLTSAIFSVRLASNADLGKTERQLGLHPLTRSLSESKTTWNDYGQGSQAWLAGGGDLGERWATLEIPAGTERATLSFDITSEIRNLEAAAPLALPMVILEIDAAPLEPAELAIVAMEGNASQSATLILTYCEP